MAVLQCMPAFFWILLLFSVHGNDVTDSDFNKKLTSVIPEDVLKKGVRDYTTEKCSGNEDCKNGGKCTDKGFCDGLPVTQDDQCKIINDCHQRENYQKCQNSGGDCIHNSTLNIGACICKNGKSFDKNKNICKDCDCGKESDFESCEFHWNDWRTCKCKPTAGKLKDGKCQKCDCGGKFEKCEFDDQNKQKCTCKHGYVLTDKGKCGKKCSTSYDCYHSSKCNDRSFCDCPSGTEGDFCELIKDCLKGRVLENCEITGGDCIYDVFLKSASCICKNGKGFDKRRNMCRECDCGDATEVENCIFNYKEEKICICKPNASKTYDGKCKTDSKKTTMIWAVLGTLSGVALILLIIYILRWRARQTE